MSEEKSVEVKDCNCKKNYTFNQGSNNAIYGFGFLGAAIYFVMHSTGFWGAIVGILKAFVWPAFIVYKVFENFNF